MKNKYPDFKGVAMCDWGASHSLVYGEKKMSSSGILLAKRL